MRKRLTFIFLILILCLKSLSQNFDSIKKSIIEEGLELYKLERAAWVSSDMVMENSLVNKYLFNNYLSYKDRNKYVSIFYSHDSFLTIIKFTAENSSYDTINEKNTILNQIDRYPTDYEWLLIKIKEDILNNIMSSTNLLEYIDKIKYNIVFLEKEKIIECFLLPGTSSDEEFFIGADYKFIYSKTGKLQEIKPLHKALMSISKFGTDSLERKSLIHSHLPEFSPFITSTDICQFKLYSKIIANCSNHIVYSGDKKYVSKYNSENDSLEIYNYKDYIKKYK